MSDEPRFDSEQAKADAIKNYDDSKGSVDDLQKIMDAPVVKAGAEAVVTPPQSTADKATPAIVPQEQADKAAVIPPQIPQATDPESVAKAKGYKSFAEMAKAFDEQRATIERSQKFINEKLQAQPGNGGAYEELLRKNQAYEQQLAALQTPQAQVQTQKSKIGVIKNALNNVALRRKELRAQLRQDPALQLDVAFIEKMQAIEDENSGLQLQLADEVTGLQSAIAQSDGRVQKMLKDRESDTLRQQGQTQYDAEMTEMDEFQSNPNHPEFKFSEDKDAETVEAEYITWANKIAGAYFGAPVNMLKGAEAKEAVHNVLTLLQQGDPAALNACQVTGQPTEPTADIRKYLDICELLDHRDGKKKNPLTGLAEQQYRTVRDAATGQFKKDAVRFPSLEDAYQHRIATDGTYQKRIKDAYSQGGKDHEDAIGRRQNAAVQMPNAAGASAVDVGLRMTQKQAMDKAMSIDENEALRRRQNGDPTMWNELEKAMEVMMAVK